MGDGKERQRKKKIHGDAVKLNWPHKLHNLAKKIKKKYREGV